MVALTGSALERSAGRQQDCIHWFRTYQQPESPRSSPQQPGPQRQRHQHRRQAQRQQEQRQQAQRQSQLHCEFISTNRLDGTGYLSRQLTSRGLSGGSSSSRLGLGGLGRGSGGRSGGSRGSSGSASSGLLLLGLGRGRLLLAALLEGSLELVLQVVKGAERCEQEVQSASLVGLGFFSLKPSPRRPLQVGGVENCRLLQPTRSHARLPIAPSDSGDQRTRKASVDETDLRIPGMFAVLTAGQTHNAIERGDSGGFGLRATSLCCFNASVGDGSGRRR